MSRNIKIAATETLEILSHLPDKFTNQIPEEFMKKLKTISLKNYKFSIDDSKSLLEQNISKDTINILIIIYRMFWCNEEERKNLDKMLVENELEYRNSIKNKTDSQNVEEIKEESCTSLVEYKDTIFMKIKLLLSRFIRKKSKS